MYIILRSNYRSQHASSFLRSEAKEDLNWVGVPLGHGLSGGGAGVGLVHPWSWKVGQELVGFRVDPSPKKLSRSPNNAR